MRYVTTNIRLPEDLWKSLKKEAADRRTRMSEVIRERLMRPVVSRWGKKRKLKSLCGIWKGIDIPDSLIEEAKRSLFPPPERYLK